jgi:hypothetical protein
MTELEQITDPFSIEFMQASTEKSLEIAHQLKENLVNVRQRVARPKTERVKFYLSRELKKRIKHLISLERQDSPVREVGQALLNKKYIDKDSINYLGLSNDDFTKISYVNKERYDKIKDKTFEQKFIVPGTRLLYEFDCITRGTHRDENGVLTFGNFTKTIRHHYVFTKKQVSEDLQLTRIKTPRELVEYPDGSKEMLYDYDYQLPKDTNMRIQTKHGMIVIIDGYFLPNRNYDNFSTKLDNLKIARLDSVWDPDQRFHSSVQKVLTKVFPTEFSASAINFFAAAFYRTVVFKDPSYTVKILEGEEIIEGYYEGNYLTENKSNLWQSCMRYHMCQYYFRIYTDYPDMVKLAVLYRHGQVAARCLLWNVKGEKYFDRVYSYNSEAESMLTASVRGLEYKMLREFYGGQIQKLEIDFPLSELRTMDAFPYMDSFQYYNVDTEQLTNYEPISSEFYRFDQTDGEYSCPTEECETFECAHCDSEFNTDEDFHLITLGRRTNYSVCDECAVYSSTLDETMLADYATYCDFTGDYFLEDDFIELVDGRSCWSQNPRVKEYENDMGYFLIDKHDSYMHDGLYYHPEDIVLNDLLANLENSENSENLENLEENEQNKENEQNENANNNTHNHPSYEAIG